ncbi:MAG: ATP-binding protein [Bacteroidales bacterium]|nr:ATP-binding protein [Bacteroidales bacterium]
MKQAITPTNPFLLSGYVSAAYFCDRIDETGKLISALQNGRNVTLISPRRMGKTGLLRHAFSEIIRQKAGNCYYVDLYQTTDLASLVKKLGEAVLGTLDTTETKMLKQISKFFSSLRPVVSFDAISGEPNLMIDVQPSLAEKSLSEILAYMESSGQRCYVAFDEFQVVDSYADRQVEALLRAHIQHLNNVRFVFSGSQRHVLENMFVAANRPFFQSTQIMNLGCIPEKAYYEFAHDKFQQHRQAMSEAVFHHLYSMMSGHTWYVQMILNRLFENGHSSISTDVVNDAITHVVAENEATYQTFMRLITSAQAKLMKAVAKEGVAKEIMGKDMIAKYALGAASTVKASAKALVEKELLLDQNAQYEVYDRFLGIWLQRL